MLPLFDAEAPDDDRARDAIARARAFARGELTAAGEIRRRFVAGRAAHSAASPAGVAAARSAAQATAAYDTYLCIFQQLHFILGNGMKIHFVTFFYHG